MNDRVIGIAVLDKTDSPERLYIRCETSAGKHLSTEIPVYPIGSPKLMEHQWEYKISGDRIYMTPSVNWVGVFHNEGAWNVQFVLFDPAEFQYPGDQFRSLNGLQL